MTRQVSNLNVYQYHVKGRPDEDGDAARWIAAVNQDVADNVADIAGWSRAGGCVMSGEATARGTTSPHTSWHGCNTTDQLHKLGVDVVLA